MSKVQKLVVFLLVLVGVVWFLARGRPAATAESPHDEATSRTNVASHAEPAPEPASEPAPHLATPPVEVPRTEVPSKPAETSVTARVRVVLVDEETRAPVPHLVAELRSSDAMLERMESDEHGRLQGSQSFAPGTYRLDLSSERAAKDLIQTRKKDEAKAFPKDVEIALAPVPETAPPVELAIPVGPTFQLVAGWPAGIAPEQFTAQLASADPRQAFDKLFTRVRPGAPPWARFSPLARFLSAGPPWGLRVTSEDGLWLALATVETLDKRALQPVRLDFTARGRITGRLLDPEDQPIVKNWVQAWLPDSSFQNPAKRPVLVLTDADGNFDLRALEPGTYTLKVEADGFDPYAGTVEVPSLSRVEHDVHVRRPDPGLLGAIRGRIRSRSGKYAGPVRVGLRPDAPPHAAQHVDADWQEVDGSKQATFEFTALVPGQYSLSLTTDDLVRVEPRRQDARPSPDVHEILIDDSGERVDVPVRVVADEDGAPITGFRVDALVQGSDAEAVARAGKDEAVTTITRAPVGATLGLTVYADPDRQILWQDVVVTRPAEPLVLRVKRGWGTRVIVHGPTDEPLVGARVFFDDQLVGTTDAHGELRVGLGHVPTVCRAEYRDWILDPRGDVLPDTGRFRAEASYLRIRLKPRE